VEIDDRFDAEWSLERASLRSSLPSLDLSGKDLRRAWASRASLVGADLSSARLDGADLSEARLEATNFNGARMERAFLGGARLEEANLSWSRLEGAVFHLARMEGVDLSGARMEGANLSEARLAGGNLSDARMEGVNLSGADIRSAKWAGSRPFAPVHDADLRGGKGLMQAQLDRMIGNAKTLLPETLEDGTVPSIPSCWSAPGPAFLDDLIFGMAYPPPENKSFEDLRAEFLCPEGKEPRRTGTPLALDVPYPDDHPLSDSAGNLSSRLMRFSSPF
jgi:hypothetical protein